MWLQLLATQEGGTFFFDEDADFVTGYTSSLRSEFVFGVPATGTDGSFGAARAIYEGLCKGTMLLFLLLLLLAPCQTRCLCLSFQTTTLLCLEPPSCSLIVVSGSFAM